MTPSFETSNIKRWYRSPAPSVFMVTVSHESGVLVLKVKKAYWAEYISAYVQFTRERDLYMSAVVTKAE